MIADGSKYLGRTCADCLGYQWSDEGVEGINKGRGTRKKYKTLQVCYDAGAVPRKRVYGTMTPCHECPKVRDSAPSKSYYFADEIDDRIWKAIEHYEECEAVGIFPDDPIVRRNAATIKRTFEACKHGEHNKGMAYLFSVLMAGAGGRGK